ncbi:MAG TPA: GNAT family N-acetyltransferase [Gaiellaceae bacterium]|nr:GNAT family N-acetyltransferase [Gaiellaceae bacterium]
MKVVEWNETYSRELEAWHYEPPYDFYDLASDPDDLASNRDPTRYEHRRAVVGEDGCLEAFWYFDRHGDATEVGIGLRPDLTGRGLGESFLRAQLEYAADRWQPATLRLFVAAWNERAIRLYERLGFREVARERRHFDLVGEHEFVQMERAA